MVPARQSVARSLTIEQENGLPEISLKFPKIPYSAKIVSTTAPR